jgi:hypothetical protein
VILTRKEKEGLVIKLAEAGKTTRDIAQVAHVSLKDIGAILRRYAVRKKNIHTVKEAYRHAPEPSNCLKKGRAWSIQQ